MPSPTICSYSVCQSLERLTPLHHMYCLYRRLYTKMDAITRDLQLFKVETIG